ncbi:hypothetical protein M569_03319, partial [Genlisea aurea]
MERYGGTQSIDVVPVDPVEEWVTPGGETGLEEPMWQLGLGSGFQSYPERPDEPDCIYYLKTGFCGYGKRCRFNHPRDRSSAMGPFRSGGGDYPERVGQPVCQYYMKTGLCKFGATCKYHHPKHGVGSSAPVTLNIYGWPLRPGEKECSYYVKTGFCKYGVTCKFHHPQPAAVQHVPDATTTAIYHPTAPVQSSQQYGVIQGNWPRPAILPAASYIPGSYGPPMIFPVPGWTPYPAPPPTSPGAQPAVGAAGAIYGIGPLSSPSAYPAVAGPYISIPGGGGGASSSNKMESSLGFPKRPGQPICQYYIRTGDCKYGATCKYHHPQEFIAPKANFVLSPMGLPLRPGAPVCSHYSQNGVCRFGPSCKFDHPMRSLSYSPSASSLTDMPVAPYPVGSTSATLAPSSSSSDLSPETALLAAGGGGHQRDTATASFPPQVSSMNISSDSVGSIFSRG